jgi:signal transduction histidine kinase
VIGLTGIARDITDKQIREQRLSVLSRVLRHNVRNRMTVVQGTASYLRDTLTDEELQRHAERITDAAQDLADLSTHARQAESILREDQQQRERIDLVTAVHNALDDVDTDRAATLDTDLPESAPMFATSGVSTAIAELVENAIRHCDDVTVRITVSIAADTVSVSVADDGPGIPDHERAVLATGEETQLEHGTGIGLWLVNWVVTAAGGDVQFRENDPDGSVVELSFPSA